VAVKNYGKMVCTFETLAEKLWQIQGLPANFSAHSIARIP